MSKLSKFVKKVFKPKNLLRIAGAALGGVPGLLITNKAIKSYEKKKQAQATPATPEAVAPTYTTTSSVMAGSPAANRATSYQTPLASPQQAAPIQIGTSSEPQAMKLQQTASPYAAANVAASQAQAAQQQQQEQKPLNQFMAPSMQGIKFGGS